MRRKKQILLTLVITAALLVLAWFAGSHRPVEETIMVLAASCDIPAGSQITADQLTLVSIPASIKIADYIETPESVIGQWTSVALSAGEMITAGRLTRDVNGLSYPDPGPGRRLITLKLDPAQANGFWLAAGNRVDLYLVPRSQDPENELQILEQIRIMAVLEESTGDALTGFAGTAPAAGRLICLDLNTAQACLILAAQGSHDIRLAVINEKPVN